MHAPEPLKDGVLEAGVGVSPARPLFQAGAREAARLVAALDVQSWQAGHAGNFRGVRAPASSWDPWGRPITDWAGPGACCVEAFRGPTPFGQFYGERISYLGIGLHFR